MLKIHENTCNLFGLLCYVKIAESAVIHSPKEWLQSPQLTLRPVSWADLARGLGTELTETVDEKLHWPEDKEKITLTNESPALLRKALWIEFLLFWPPYKAAVSWEDMLTILETNFEKGTVLEDEPGIRN